MAMPKLKTHRGAAKRFKLTRTGKIRFKRANKRHLLEHQSAKAKRHLRPAGLIAKADKRAVRQMMPYV